MVGVFIEIGTIWTWTGLDWIWDLGIEIGLDKNTNLELFKLHIWLKLKQE